MSNNSKTKSSKLLDKEVLTDENLMDLLSVSKSSLKRWRQKGWLQSFKLGASNYYETKLFLKTIRKLTHPVQKKKNNSSELNAILKKTNDKE